MNTPTLLSPERLAEIRRDTAVPINRWDRTEQHERGCQVARDLLSHIDALTEREKHLRSIIRAAYLDTLDRVGVMPEGLRDPADRHLSYHEQMQLGRDLAEWGSTGSFITHPIG
jgi:hypothetical protein